MKIITVHCKTKPGKQAELISLCNGMIAPSRAENGCRHYSFYQDLHDRDAFLFYEEWDDQSSIDRHNKTKHFLDFQSKFAQLTEGDPVIAVRTVE